MLLHGGGGLVFKMFSDLSSYKVYFLLCVLDVLQIAVKGIHFESSAEKSLLKCVINLL